MIIAEIPEQEAARLEVLNSYSILDSLPESEYDDLTRICAEICQTPISLVSLVDTNRQWFKSHHGIDLCEAPRDFAFCAHAILKPEEVMVVEDTLQDPRFMGNPFVTNEPHVRFYTGVPLVNASNHALGTLCVIDFEPRKLTIGQIESLKALANQVMHLFESRRNQMLLSKTMKALQEKNIQMEEFNFTACHDLQEPLQTITNFSELLIKKGSLDKESTFYVDLINSSAKRMKELITGLLEYSQIDKGLKIEEVDCNEILEQVKIDLLYSIEQNEATLEIANLPTIRTNKAGIKQVFQNLISNAIKFHKPGVNPKIKIDVIQSDGQFQFCVQDNGIGIKKEFYGNVFSIFNRLHNSNEYQGLGIGLAHSKKILEALGGEIWIESEFGVGSKFYFKLPLII